MADVDIDTIQIEVSANASSATNELNKLAKSLSSLEAVLSGSLSTELSSLVTSLGQLSTAVARLNLAPLTALKEVKVSKAAVDNLATLANTLNKIPEDTATKLAGLGSLSSLSGIKVSSTIPNNITKLVNAIAAMPADATGKIRSLSSALAGFRSLEGMKLTSAINGIKRIPEALAGFKDMDVSNLVNQLNKLNPTLTVTAQNLERVAAAFKQMPSSIKSVTAATKQAANVNKTAEASTKSYTNSIGGLMSKVAGFAAKVGTITMVANVLKSTLGSVINNVNTYIENMNLFAASMGEYTEAATDFGMKCQELLGIDFSDWARNEGVFQTLITGMGETADRASVMSQQLTQLGYDIASFYNIRVDDAMLKIQSGIAGELEPLRRLGWDLSNARMQLEATKMGIDENVSSMTQAEKVGLRYYLIMNQVTQTHGDMARTIASPANQIRVLQAQIALAARAIGNLFIPALNAILPVVIAVVKAIRLLAQTIANFFGIDATFEVDYSTLDTSGIAGASDAFDKSGKAADKAKKKVQEYKNTVMGFDELNKLNDIPDNSSSDGSGSGDGDGVGGIDFPLDTYDFLAGLTDQINEFSDKLAQAIVSALGKILPLALGIGAAFAAWKGINALLPTLDKMSAYFDRMHSSSKELAKIDPTMKGATESATRFSIPLIVSEGMVKKIVQVIGKFKGLLAPIAVAIGVVVASFADLWVNSENFRRGLAEIGRSIGEIFGHAADNIGNFFSEIARGFGELVKFFSSIDEFPILSALVGYLDDIVKVIGSALSPVIDTLSGLLGGLDLSFGDVGRTTVFLISKFVHFIPVVGQVCAVVEALSLIIRGIGYAVAPSIEKVDALGDVSEETASKFGTSCDSMYDAQKQLEQNSFSDAVVSQEDVDKITKSVEDVRETILNNLDSKRNADLANLDTLGGMVDEDTMNRMRDDINRTHDEMAQSVQAGQARISEIYSTAARENRDLKQEECDEISRIQGQLQDALIQTSGATADEMAKISDAMANNQKEAAISAASEVVKQAIKTRDETVAAAWQTYDGQKAIAQGALESGAITQEEYNKIEQAAWNTANSATIAANEAYYGADGVVNKTREGLGDAKNQINMDTGEIATNWEVFCADFSEGWNQTWSDVYTNASTWMNDTGASLSRGMDSIARDFWTWYDSSIKPKTDSIGRNFEILGNNIKQFMSDPVGHLEGIWGGFCGWFNGNVAQPLRGVFNSILGGIEAFINGCVSALNQFHVDLPDPIKQVTGWSSFGFNLNYVHIPRFAKGGFVDTGQLFIANERGAEMVGQMGGKTTVANNQQIIDGIEAGVTRAMLQVLSVQGRGSGERNATIEIPLIIDGEELARANYQGSLSLIRRGEIIPDFI